MTDSVKPVKLPGRKNCLPFLLLLPVNICYCHTIKSLYSNMQIHENSKNDATSEFQEPLISFNTFFMETIYYCEIQFLERPTLLEVSQCI